MPGLARVEHPAVRVGAKQFLWCAGKRDAHAALRICDLLGIPGGEKPAPPLVNSRRPRARVCRKSIASLNVSLVSASPPGPSIIADAISLAAMMAYNGEVVLCIIYASLKRSCSMGARPSRTWMNDACESAASSLCVDWVVGRKEGRLVLCGDFLAQPHPAPTIIICHGYRVSRDYMRSAAALAYTILGCNLLLFDFRGHGESDSGSLL
jgi:hypothetical protein